MDKFPANFRRVVLVVTGKAFTAHLVSLANVCLLDSVSLKRTISLVHNSTASDLFLMPKLNSVLTCQAYSNYSSLLTTQCGT